MTGFECHTSIVILTSEPYHDIHRETVFEVSCHFYGDDMGFLDFEDNKFAIAPDFSMTSDGGDFVFHGVGDELCTIVMSVFVAWYPTAGGLLCLKGVGASLYVPGFTYHRVIVVGVLDFVFTDPLMSVDAAGAFYGSTGVGEVTLEFFKMFTRIPEHRFHELHARLPVT